jgi:hypothetical protein
MTVATATQRLLLVVIYGLYLSSSQHGIGNYVALKAEQAWKHKERRTTLSIYLVPDAKWSQCRYGGPRGVAGFKLCTAPNTLCIVKDCLVVLNSLAEERKLISARDRQRAGSYTTNNVNCLATVASGAGPPRASKFTNCCFK